MSNPPSTSRNNSLLQVPTTGTQRNQSHFDRNTKREPTSFFLGSETPSSRQSVSSKVHSRRGSSPAQHSEEEHQHESGGFSNDNRNTRVTSNLNKLKSKLKLVKAHTQGQGGGSVDGRRSSRGSRGGSSSGNESTGQ